MLSTRQRDSLTGELLTIANTGVTDGRRYTVQLFPEEAQHLLDGLATDSTAITAAIDRLTAALEAATAPPAVDVEPHYPINTWAHVELMGHRVITGFVGEQELAGRRMLRVQSLRRADRERGLGEPDPPLQLDLAARLYSPAAIYSFEELTEAEARTRYLNRHGLDDEMPY